MMKNNYDLANICCIRSIDLLPDNREAYINMNNIMRHIGRKEYAFSFVWNKVCKSYID